MRRPASSNGHHRHHHRSSISLNAIIFGNRSIIIMLMTAIKAGRSSPMLTTGVPLAFFSTSINNDLHARTIERRRIEKSHRSYRSRRRNLSHYYLSSSPEFPHDHDDPEDKWENMISASSSSTSHRQNFGQRRLGVVPNDRRNKNVVMEVSNEDDEWTRYYDMDDIELGDIDGNGINLIVDNSQSPHLQKEQVGRTTTRTSDEDGKKKSTQKIITPIRRNPRLSENINRSADDLRNHSTSPEIRYDLSAPDDESQHQQRQLRLTTEQINDIKASVSLVDIIESYNLPHFTRISSYAQTSTAKACCPFHDDHNPSMSIDDSRGLYKCFACGAGGDVFNFIREFDYLSKVKDGKEKMGYMQAVEFVAQEFDGNSDVISTAWNYKSNAKGDTSDETKEYIRKREWKKERIRRANTAAAAFYTKCLVTLPSAGKARAHLRSRKLSPESVKTFAIGYAPDCYYGDEGGGWGSGSLVEYLADQGFAPNEIVESGLAARTKPKQFSVGDRGRQINDSLDVNGGEKLADEEDRHDYSDLIDRFRSRLIIPIMDESGQHVIALGGRHLQAAAGSSDDSVSEENEKSPSSFTPAKYINSPDSLVFTKKNVLFNKARATRALEEHLKIPSAAKHDSSMATTTSFVPSPAIVVVEGYLDVIALTNVGIQNVVASMGTALPVEQLKLVAKMRNSAPGGRIILCMDGDDAGKNAVERLCSSNILSNVPELSKNELFVATLSGGEVKDPSDFVTLAGGGNKARMRFQEEILDNAIPWDEWYIDRLLSKHEVDSKDGTVGSFAGICNDVSTFLASFSNPADRTRRVHKIAEKLVALIAEVEMSSSSIGMLRAQLESDILNMSSRKAGVREAIERRIEVTDGVSGEATASKMKRLSRGDLDNMNDDERKMSKSASSRLAPQRADNLQRSIPALNPLRARKDATRTRSFRTNPKKTKKPQERHLVPHFNGFEFKHQSDKDWLGLSGKSPMMHLGEAPGPVGEKDRLRAETPMFEDKYRPPRKKEEMLYFNSNRYLGEQYLLPQAIRAGYELGNERPSPGESLVEFTERKLFQSPNPDQLIKQAESRLIHALAKFPQARMAMRSVYSASTFGPSNLRWTSEERKWLFLCLTGSPQIDPPLPAELLDGGNQFQLHLHLANRDDCPNGSFNRNDIKPVNDRAASLEFIETTIETSVDRPDYEADSLEDESGKDSFDRSEVEVLAPENDELDSILDIGSQAEVVGRPESIDGNTNGLLDEFFLETDMFPSFDNNKITKETRAELTVQESISTLLRASAMKRFSIAKENLTRIVHEMDRRGVDDEGGKVSKHDFDGVSSEELQTLFEKVGNEVVEAQRSLYDSERSTDRVNSHLLDYSVTNGVKYKLSQSELERLDQMMDEHISSLPDSSHRPETPGHDGSYAFGADEFDENINPIYGGRNPDEYVVKGLPDGESKWD